jgi:hypothetical protein
MFFSQLSKFISTITIDDWKSKEIYNIIAFRICYYDSIATDGTGEWRKLHNEELHNLYSSPDIIRQIKSRRMWWAGHVERMGEERKVYKVLVGKPEGKRPLGRPRRRWEDGIRMDINEIGWGGVDWIRLAQDKDRWRSVVSAVMNLRVFTPRI